jgi:hypothetical protein
VPAATRELALEGGARTRLLAALLARAWPPATGAALVALATGAAWVALVLPSWHALVHSGYGIAALASGAVLAALALLTLVASRVVIPALRARGERGQTTSADGLRARAALRLQLGLVAAAAAVCAAIAVSAPPTATRQGLRASAPAAVYTHPCMPAGTPVMPGMPRCPASAPRAVRTGAAACATRSCLLPAPAPNELGVADELGTAVAAAWLRPYAGGLTGRVELLDPNMQPIDARPAVAGATSAHACGRGCLDFAVAGRPATLLVSTREAGRYASLALPVRWSAAGATRARALLERALATMKALHSVRLYETLSAGPGTFEGFRFRFTRDAFAYRMNSGSQTVTIGARQWSRTPPGAWQESAYGGGAAPFALPQWFDWGNYAESVRLLSEHDGGTHPSAQIALTDVSLPVWFRLDIDLRSGRVTGDRMIAGGHFMSDSYYAYDSPNAIAPPR